MTISWFKNTLYFQFHKMLKKIELDGKLIHFNFILMHLNASLRVVQKMKTTQIQLLQNKNDEIITTIIIIIASLYANNSF